MMRGLHEERHITFIFSTHDTRLVELAERVVALRDGEIVDDFVR
jgi:putative ABC transport system ATP-binding protein